jgi:dihydrolipoamide dehydrogenase
MAENTDYDVIVLGGGSGGYVAAIRAAQLGLHTAVIEQDKVGGTCLHRGCIPTKVFIESAEVLNAARRAAEFGIQVGEVGFDWPAIVKRRVDVVGVQYRGVEGTLRGLNIEIIKERGHLVGPTTVAVGADFGLRELTAKDVIVATGSEPKSLPSLPVDGKRVITSDHAVNLENLPASMVVVGAGAVGVEFAYVYASFGVKVTVVEFLPSLVPLEDKEVAQRLDRSFRRMGIEIMVGAEVKEMADKDGLLELLVNTKDGEQRVVTDQVLSAVGRGACVRDVGLEQVGVKVERNFIVADNHLRTNVPHVYAVGDCIGGYMLAHKAYADGIVAAETIAGAPTYPQDPNGIPRATYCIPQIASVGLTEDQAREQAGDIKVGKYQFAANAKAHILGERDGFVKIIADRSGELLGAHIIGPKATEILQEIVVAKRLESTALEVGVSVHSHPTLSEAVWEAARDIENMRIHGAH